MTGWLDTRDTSEGASELFKHACKDICPCKAVVLDYQCGGVSCPLTFGSLSPLIATVAHAILFWLVVITLHCPQHCQDLSDTKG